MLERKVYLKGILGNVVSWKRGRGTWKSDKPPVVTMVKKGGTRTR